VLDDLVLVLLVAAAVPLVLAAVPRLLVPAAVLEIVAGIVLGPDVLDLVDLDQAVQVVSTIGLAFLLFLAGLEIDLASLRGRSGQLALRGLAASLVLAALVGAVLDLAGIVGSGTFVAVLLIATSLGLVVPVLRDAQAADRPLGRLVVAGASLGEVAALVLLSLSFSESGTGPGTVLLLVLALAGAAVLLVLTGRRAARSPRIVRTVDRLADTSAQLRVRLTVLLVVGLGAVAERLGLEAILGAFLAGVVLRAVDPDGTMSHPHFRHKLEGLAFGFVVPVFFVASGLAFDLGALTAGPGALAMVAVFLAALLLVRGLPALAYRTSLTGREVVAAGLLQATSLPFLVAGTAIGSALGAIDPEDAAALVGAGLLSVVLFPALALRLANDTGADTDSASGVTLSAVEER